MTKPFNKQSQKKFIVITILIITAIALTLDIFKMKLLHIDDARKNKNKNFYSIPKTNVLKQPLVNTSANGTVHGLQKISNKNK